ncbi:MAG TPA: radical SAM protein [Parachlamydiaceae bacterium]|nr:radical SAM protein [Parachlamydiaceae bacterium]
MDLNIIEIFASVQGETSFTGLPTTFIRLAACNLRCSWCDTSYSFGRGEKTAVDAIIETVKKNGLKNVCITGGEPLLQENVYFLIESLLNLNYIVSIETGGSLPINKIDARTFIILDIKCPASGMSEKNLWQNLDILPKNAEVKFVIQDKADYEYAKSVAEKYELYQRASAVLFSPVFNILKEKTLVEWILEDRLNVRLNLQTHKYIWDPLTRGV